MPEPVDYPSEFENLLQTAMAASEPDPAFMDSLRSQFLARARLTQKETRLKPYHLHFSPRLAWVLALLFFLALILVALSSPDVVKAMQRLLGYIPGVGTVEQTTSLRVLAQPVTQSRAGITLTIEQAVATADQTVFVYHYVEQASFIEHSPTPDSLPGDPELRLPDGRQLEIILGHRLSTDPQDPPGAALRYQMKFGPLPVGVDQVVVFLPQLIPMQPGAGPENWEIPIHFRASAESEGLPVLEVNPTATVPPENTILAPAASAPASATPDLAHGISFVLDKVVPLPDGYILMGQTRWHVAVPEDTTWFAINPASVTITDANGQVVPNEPISPDQNPQPGISPWSYRLSVKDLHWPVTIQADSMTGDISYGSSLQSQMAFQFDPGPSPHPGQTWALDQSFKVDQYNFHLSAADMAVDPDTGNYRYEFTLDSPDGVVGAVLSDLDQPEIAGGGGGGGGDEITGSGPFIAKLEYGIPRPITGKQVRVTVDGLNFVFRGSWQITWSHPKN